MPALQEPDGALRKEILDTLETNPTASFNEVLANWRERNAGVIDGATEARLAAIYDEECADAAEHPRRHYHGGRRAQRWPFQS